MYNVTSLFLNKTSKEPDSTESVPSSFTEI